MTLGWLEGARWLHIAFLVIGAIGALAFLVRTRCWFPRYLHWMAVIAFGIGLAMLRILPDDDPGKRAEWGLLKTGLMLLVFPALVYGTFVFYGGQRAAYESRHVPQRCPHCGEERDAHWGPCDTCGQLNPPEGGLPGNSTTQGTGQVEQRDEHEAERDP